MAKLETSRSLNFVHLAPAAPAEVRAEEAPVERAAPPVKRFRVREEARIPRMGSYFTLPEGKVITNNGYDIDELIARGVKLEEVTS